MEMDCNKDFWKNDRMSVFQSFKFGSEIFEILQKLCCIMEFLEEIALLSPYFIDLVTILCIYNSFE